MQRARPYKATPFKAPAKISKISVQRKQSIQDARGFSRFLGSKAEKKVNDLAIATYPFDTTGSVTALNLIATGTDFTNRVGRKILMKSVNIIGVVQPNDTSVSTTLCRALLIYDKQPNGALPAITDILNTSNSKDQINLNNRDRFVILRDWFQALAPQQDTATQAYAGSPTTNNLHMFVKLNHETIYNSTAGTIAAVTSGSLLLVTVGDSTNTNTYSLSASTRIRFIDA